MSNEYSGGGQVTSIEQPNQAVLTNPKQKLVTCKRLSADARLCIPIYDTDSPMTVKIKEFMAMYNIIDITMRMLKIEELKLIMGFPEDYELIGTQADQKKFIGNAVEVTIARKWCEALCAELYKRKIKQPA